jgi:hypothetical protein
LKLLQTPELRTIFLAFNFSRDELPSSDIKGRNPLRDVREGSSRDHRGHSQLDTTSGKVRTR